MENPIKLDGFLWDLHYLLSFLRNIMEHISAYRLN